MFPNKHRNISVFFKYFNVKLKLFSTVSVPNPVKLAYAVYESESTSSVQAPFVIAHGLFGSKQNWTSLCKAYSQKIKPPRKVIAVDLRNHGDSTHTDVHTYAHLAEDLRLFILENDLRKVALMGHSMGGRCAMLFALTYPELIEKLIVVDISPINLSPNINEMPIILEVMSKVEMPKNVPLSQARAIVDKQLATTLPDVNIRAFILTNLVASSGNSYKWRVNIPTLIKEFSEIAKFSAADGAQYDGDTLFIGGENSSYIPKLIHRLQITKPWTVIIRFKTDLAQTDRYSNIVDLSYASYQSTDAIFGKVRPENIPTPVIVIHGLFGSKSNINTICKRYHDGFKPKRLVYAVDLRNHGDSTHSNSNTYDDLVMDLLKFIKTMNLSKVTILGHDIGGRVGMLIALKDPDFIEKLIVAEASPISTSHSFQVFPEVLRILNNIIFPPNLPFQLAKAHVVNCLSRVVRNKNLMSVILMNLVQTSEGSYIWRFNNRSLLDNFSELSMFPNVHNVEFKGPVLFVGGGKSDYIQRSDFPKIVKLFPKAELKYIEGAGHWVHAEKPNEFLKITMDFLNKDSVT